MGTNILVNIEDQTGGSSSGSMGNVPGLSASGITVQGTSSVCLIIASIPMTPASDSTAKYQLTVNGSATGSPINHAFTDASSGDNNDATICWAVTDLSGGSNSFAVQWQTVTGSPAKDTGRVATLLVLEITGGDAVIEYDGSASDQVGSPATWGDLFDSGNITIAGPLSVIILLAVVPQYYQSDDRMDFQFAVDSTPEGPEGCAHVDAPLEGSGYCGIHILDGLSAGTHSFQLQWQDGSGTPQTQAAQRIFQVIEITTGATLKVDNITAASFTVPATFGDDTTLDDVVNVGGTSSVMLHVANGCITPGSDLTAAVRLAIDDAQEGADILTFTDTSSMVTSFCLGWAKTGISAGNHDFSLQWDAIQGTPTAWTSKNRSQYVVEFAPTTTYHLAGVTKDKDGNTKATCECHLWKWNSGTPYWVGYTQSDGSGDYDFTGIGTGDADYFVVSFKADSPHVMDITDHVLQPIEE